MNELVTRYLEGRESLSAEELRALVAHLELHPAELVELRAQLALDDLLARRFDERRAVFVARVKHAASVEAIGASSSVARREPFVRGVMQRLNQWAAVPGRRWAWPAFATSVAAAAFLISVLLTRQNNSTVGERPPVRAAGPMAMVAETKDAEWEPGGLPDPKDNGAASQFKLKAGLARIDFRDGDWLTLVGPAHVEVLGPNRVRLHQGRITAGAASPQLDFKVEAAAMSVTGRRSEFGVLMAPDRRWAEVNALNGTVNATIARNGREDSWQITNGEAWDYDVNSGRRARTGFSGTRFPRKWATHAGGPLVFGDVRYLSEPPQSLADGAIESDQTIYLISESKNRVLPAVRAVTANRFYRGAALHNAPVELPAGARVDSYVVHFDPIHDNTAVRSQITGSVTFKQAIVGVIVGQEELAATDSALGIPRGAYSSGTRTGAKNFDHPNFKDVAIQADRKTVIVGVGEATGLLQLRILVEAAPAGDSDEQK